MNNSYLSGVSMKTYWKHEWKIQNWKQVTFSIRCIHRGRERKKKKKKHTHIHWKKDKEI